MNTVLYDPSFLSSLFFCCWWNEETKEKNRKKKLKKRWVEKTKERTFVLSHGISTFFLVCRLESMKKKTTWHQHTQAKRGREKKETFTMSLSQKKEREEKENHRWTCAPERSWRTEKQNEKNRRERGREQHTHTWVALHIHKRSTFNT